MIPLRHKFEEVAILLQDVAKNIAIAIVKRTCKSIDCTYQGDGKNLHSIRLIFVAEIVYRDNVIGICDNLGAGFTRSITGVPQLDLAAPQTLGETV